MSYVSRMWVRIKRSLDEGAGTCLLAEGDCCIFRIRSNLSAVGMLDTAQTCHSASGNGHPLLFGNLTARRLGVKTSWCGPPFG